MFFYTIRINLSGFRKWCLVLSRYLLISHVIRVSGRRLLHGNQGEHLEKMVLHDVTERRKVKSEERGVVKITVIFLNTFRNASCFLTG